MSLVSLRFLGFFFLYLSHLFPCSQKISSSSPRLCWVPFLRRPYPLRLRMLFQLSPFSGMLFSPAAPFVFMVVIFSITSFPPRMFLPPHVALRSLPYHAPPCSENLFRAHPPPWSCDDLSDPVTSPTQLRFQTHLGFPLAPSFYPRQRSPRSKVPSGTGTRSVFL